MNRLTAFIGFLSFLLLVLPLLASAASPSGSRAKLKVAIVKNDSEGPKYMAEGGLPELLDKLGCEVSRIGTVALTPPGAGQGRPKDLRLAQGRRHRNSLHTFW